MAKKVTTGSSEDVKKMQKILDTVFPEVFKQVDLESDNFTIESKQLSRLYHSIVSHFPELLDLDDERKEATVIYLLNNAIRSRYKDDKTATYKIKKNLLIQLLSSIVLSYYAKYCKALRRLLVRLIREVIEEKERYAPYLMKRFFSFYERSIYEVDLLTYLLISLFHKYDPRIIENLSAFYSDIIRRLISFNLSGKLENVEYVTQSQIGADVPNIPVYNIDPETIYQLFYLQMYCYYAIKPHTLQMIYNHFKILSETVMTNELRKVVFSTTFDPVPQLKDKNQDFFTFLWITIIQKDLLKHLTKRYPSVAKLLKCVQIHKGETRSFRIRDIDIEKHIYNWIKNRFKSFFDGDTLEEVAIKVASKFTRKLCTGEYINLLTFETVYITDRTFPEQLISFFDELLSEIKQESTLDKLRGLFK